MTNHGFTSFRIHNRFQIIYIYLYIYITMHILIFCTDQSIPPRTLFATPAKEASPKSPSIYIFSSKEFYTIRICTYGERSGNKPAQQDVSCWSTPFSQWTAVSKLTASHFFGCMHVQRAKRLDPNHTSAAPSIAINIHQANMFIAKLWSSWMLDRVTYHMDVR